MVVSSFTVILQVNSLPSTLAVIVAIPFFFAFTLPLEVTVATDFLSLDHFTVFFAPVTFNCKVLPIYNVAFFY